MHRPAPAPPPATGDTLIQRVLRRFGAGSDAPVTPRAGPPPTPAQVFVVSCSDGTLRLRGPGLDHRRVGADADAHAWAVAALAAHATTDCAAPLAGRADAPGSEAVTDWACLHLGARYWIGTLIAEGGRLRMVVPGEERPLLDLDPGAWSWAAAPTEALRIESGPTQLPLLLAGGEAMRRDIAARDDPPTRVLGRPDDAALAVALGRGRLVRVSLDGIAVPARPDALRPHSGGWSLRLDATIAVRDGAGISITVAAEDGLYACEGTVSGVWSVHRRHADPSGERLLRLATPVVWTRHNVRSSGRSAVDLPGTVEFSGERTAVQLVDLSVEGAGLRCRAPLPIGAAVVLVLAGADGPLRLPGRVVRARPRATHPRVGLRFDPLTLASTDALRAFILAAGAAG